MGFDPPSRAAGHSPPHPELIQFLKGKNLDDQLETLLQMSETDLAKMADEYGCDSGEGEQLEKLLKQERDRREREPSVGGRLAEELKKSGAQTDGKKVHVPVELRGETFHVSQEHRWATRVHEAQFPQEFVDQRVTKDTVILLLGDHASKQTLINLMLNYNVGMKLRERRLEMDVDQGTMVHSAMAAFKIPAILGGRLQSRLTIVNAPDFDKVGMDGLIANQVEEFLARHIDSISGVCCLVEGNKDTPEAYKEAFNAVLKQLGQGIAEHTILCIMSGEGSGVDEKRLQKIQNSMRKAGVLYRRAAYFKCPALHEIESAAASLAWQSISDNFAEFFTSLNGNFTLKRKDARVDSNEVARKQLLELLEKNPQAAQADLDAEKEVRDVLEDAPKAAKRIVVIGGTGAGKSAFCGLLDGSLKRDPNIKGKSAWSSNFKLGHKLDSETKEPKLKVCDWCGVDATFPIIIMDTPGPGDSRGGETDEKHLRTIAGWVNGLSRVHLVILLVNPDGTITGPLRTILQEFEERFGRKLWAHTMVAVNKWDFDGDASPEEFEEQFREVIQVRSASALPCQTSDPLPGPVSDAPLGETSNAHVGLGLTEKEEEERNMMLPFAFLNVQYRSDQTRVAEAMETELDKMKAKLKELTGWDVRVKAQSKPLNALIDAVRKSNDSATLKQVLDSVNSMVDKPTDLTEEKLSAVEEEILRREDLEAAEESLTKAVEAFNSFKEEGTSKHAETFVQKLDMAIKKLPDALMNRRISRLKPSWGMLKAALEGKRELSQDLPMELRQKVNQLLEEIKGMKKIETILSAWNIKLSKDQLNQLQILGMSSEEDLAQHISQAGLSNFPPAHHPRAKILKEWNGLKDSSMEKLTWKAANGMVKKLEELLRGSQAAKVPQEQIQKMENKLRKAKAEQKRERTFTTMKVDMAWRPFGSLAGERTRLSLQNGPEAFDPAQEICLKFTDRQEYVTAVKLPMERDAGVQLYVLDLQCESRIPTGDLNATLVTSEEECSFSGEMTLPGKATFKLPFDDTHWYNIKAFRFDQYDYIETLMYADQGKSGEDVPISKARDGCRHRPGAQFRFLDTGEGRREFRIYLRHSEKAITNHSKFWCLVQHSTDNDRDKDWQIWTVEEAGSGYYFIKSKKDGKLIYDHPAFKGFYEISWPWSAKGMVTDWEEDMFTLRDFCGEDRQKFEFLRFD